MAGIAAASSRRGSGLGLTSFPQRPPPLVTTKANSLSLPDSPTVAGAMRGRSNSLRVVDDILLRRSNSLRQGLTSIGSGRRKSSLEDIGLSHFSSSVSQSNYINPIKIALNGSIGLEVTPPEENSPPLVSSNTALIVNHPSSIGLNSTGSTLSLVQSGLPMSSSLGMSQPLLGISPPSPTYGDLASSQQTALPTISTGPSTPDPQHLQGTIV